ncbi:MAG: lysophospholipid acyltransferase family protein [Deltaproteobacteria bacterium]|nr:lysophospholipid acyltransferase family protein [Deltaproteobacteria bacterium]
MRRPTEHELSLLKGFERTAFAIADKANRDPDWKRRGQRFLDSIGKLWVYLGTSKLTSVDGLEHVRNIDRSRGVVLVSNHNTMWDFYVISSVLLRSTDWVERMYFPVRSSYFYERLDGVLVNALMSAMAMYPPVLREKERKAFNRFVVDFITDEASRPGSLIGYHPEGTRNKTAEPYTLLSANAGIGEIIYQAQPVVIPVCIMGLVPDLVTQVRGNFDGTGMPVTVNFGAPIDLSERCSMPQGPEAYRALADYLRLSIMRVGQKDYDRRVRDGMPLPGPPPRFDTSPNAAELDRMFSPMQQPAMG